MPCRSHAQRKYRKRRASGQAIVSLGGKDFYLGPPRQIGSIDSGLASLVKAIETHNIASIAIPALGCGLGGLK